MFLFGWNEPEQDPEVLTIIPEHLAHRYRVKALRIEANKLYVQMADPTNLVAIDDIRLITGYDVEVVPGMPGLRGLQVDRPFPLQETRVQARVSGPLAWVRLWQRFGNPHSEPIEAAYAFPVPDGAAVNQFRMRVGERLIEGVVQELGQARESYAEGKTSGHRVALLEMTGDGMLLARVGNLPPGEQVALELSYAVRLPQIRHETELRIPLVAAPRYLGPNLPRVSEGASGPGLSVEVRVDGGGEFECTYPVRVDGERVALSRSDCRLDRDFVLRILRRTSVPRTDLRVHGEHFMLSVTPPDTAVEGMPRDIVILLDRSGSMSGLKMLSARRAVREFVARLAPEDRFMVLAFDGCVERFERDFTAASPEAARRVSSWLDTIDARGGTELMGAMRIMHGLPEVRGRMLCAVVITDGQVGNEREVYGFVRKHLAAWRVFTLGIDTAVHEAFLRQVARLGRGQCQLVQPGLALEETLRQLEFDTRSPVITDLRLVDRGLNYLEDSLAPQPLPDLFCARPVVITGRCLGAGGVELVGRLAATGEEWRARPPVVPCENPALGILWARDRVDTLVDRQSIDPRADVRREVIGLAVAYRLLTPFTAFVLVDRAETVAQDATSVLQPLETPAEWGGVDCSMKDISAQDFGPMDDGEDEEISLDKLRELVDEAPIVRVVNLIVSQAVNDRATHIHIEPEARSCVVRYRVDGVLHDVMSPPRHILAPLVARFKAICGLCIQPFGLPQFGTFTLTHDGRDFHVRVSTLPTVHGEKVVCELREVGVTRQLEQLGLLPEQLEALREVLGRRWGMVLLAGPPRSGLSTTMMACLHALQASGRQPTLLGIEGHEALKGAVIAHPSLALDAGLRGAEAQDTDLLGMCQPLTLETAPAMVGFSATQGQVLAVCRATDAVEALELLGTWVAPARAASAVQAVMSQRLVRATCPDCAGTGCPSCFKVGFRGQVAVFEVLVLDDALRQAWLSGRLRESAVYPRLAEVARRLPVHPNELNRVLRTNP